MEFNKAALSLSDSIAPEQKKTALNRLLKVRWGKCPGRRGNLSGAGIAHWCTYRAIQGPCRGTTRLPGL